MSILLKQRSHAQDVVAPSADAARGQAINIKFKISVEFFRAKNQLPIRPWRDRNFRKESDGCGHHVAFVVVRMFSDKIHATGSTKNSRLAAKDLFEVTCQFRGFHL